MPFRILTSPLRLLRSLYGPPGQLQAPLDIEYGLPIQVIHDVSREVELGEIEFPRGTANDIGVSNYFTINVDLVHPGVDTQTALIGIYDNQNTSWALNEWIPPDPKTHTVWVLGVAANTQAGACNGAEVSLDFNPKAGAGAGFAPRMLIWRANLASALVDADGNQAMTSGTAAGEVARMMPGPLPLWNKVVGLTPISFTSRSTGIEVVDFFITCVSLPIGVFPPGMM